MPITNAGFTNLQKSAASIIFVQGFWSEAQKPALAIGQTLSGIKKTTLSNK